MMCFFGLHNWNTWDGDHPLVRICYRCHRVEIASDGDGFTHRPGMKTKEDVIAWIQTYQIYHKERISKTLKKTKPNLRIVK